jgi:hypothetical protein
MLPVAELKELTMALHAAEQADLQLGRLDQNAARDDRRKLVAAMSAV